MLVLQMQSLQHPRRQTPLEPGPASLASILGLPVSVLKPSRPRNLSILGEPGRLVSTHGLRW